MARIVNVEEVTKDEEEKFNKVKKAKAIGKTIRKVAGGILISVLAFYGILLGNRDILRHVNIL